MASRKRQYEEDDLGEEEELDPRVAKARRMMEAAPAPALSREEINRRLLEADQADVVALDSTGLKRVVTTLEKKLKKNQEMRLRHPTEPEKFMDSEVDLSEAVKKTKALAAAPELYGEFVQQGGISLLLTVLSHENVDLAAEGLDVLAELTAPEGDIEEEDAQSLVDALMSGQLVAALVQNLSRLQEKEDADHAQAVHHTLAVVENLVELLPSVAEPICSHEGFLPWLLNRLCQPPTDANRLYCAEVLAILLHSSTANQRLMAHPRNLDLLLTALAPYRKRAPAGLEEEELVSDLFDCVCCVLLVPDNHQHFRNAQGVELLLRLMQEKSFSRPLSLRAVDYALTGSPADCQHFVQALGLKSLFAAFMGKGMRKKEADEAQDEEHVLSALVSLSRFCSGEAQERLLYKFAENQGEKLERLVELRHKYAAKVKKVDDRVKRQREARRQLEEELDAEEEEMQEYLARLEGGLSCLQFVDLLFAHLLHHPLTPAQLRPRVLQVLNLHNVSSAAILSSLQEYMDHLGADAKEESRRVKDLIAATRDLKELS